MAAVLVLEDSDERIKWFRSQFPGASISKTVMGATYMMERAHFDLIFLDHDLEEAHYDGDESVGSTGRDAAKFLACDPSAAHLKEAHVIIHSLNPDGAKSMHDTLAEAGFDVTLIPFLKLKERTTCV